jgi:propionyl-CoA carboxylase beta chain
MTITPARITDLIAAIETARAGLMDEARPAAVQRVHARGRLSARERLDRLIDKGSFREMGALVTPEDGAHDGDPEASTRARAQTPADGVAVGTAAIEGRPVVIFSQDFSVHGGSIGKLGSAKTQRALQIAITRGLPLVMVLDGGGHRIQPTACFTIWPGPRAGSRWWR